jgi:enoyl-CoA hydratase
MTVDLVTYESEGPIATITLCRGEKFNALDMPMLAALEAAIVRAEADREARVVLLCGQGKGFCAGGDIAAWGDLDPDRFQNDWVKTGHLVFDRLARLRQPLIAVLHGHTFGGGLELAATADFRVAEQHMKIGLPETSVGVTPGWSGTKRLVRRFGVQPVRRMALGGERFSAHEALGLGLVDRVVETGAGLAAARAWADEITGLGPIATETTKLMLLAAEGEDTGAAMDMLGSGLVARTGDLRAGVAAFKQKTKPRFSRE